MEPIFSYHSLGDQQAQPLVLHVIKKFKEVNGATKIKIIAK